jgi:putative membrane protein
MQTSRLHSISLAAACALGFVISAGAQTPGAGTTGSPSTNTTTPSAADAKTGGLSSTDRQFVKKAAMGGLAEVQLGKLAQQKATSDQVKMFAEHMVQDHTQANDELKAIATTKGDQVPAEPSEKHKAAMQKLQKLSGAEFDREYMKLMVADHKETVADFKKQAQSGKDADLKGFAASTLPKLEEHLKMAQSVSESTRATKG